MELMRDHFEGSDFDMTKDVGAGPYQLPYRWRPLTWEVDGVKYVRYDAVIGLLVNAVNELSEKVGA